LTNDTSWWWVFLRNHPGSQHSPELELCDCHRLQFVHLQHSHRQEFPTWMSIVVVLILDFPMNLLLTKCSLHFYQPTSPSHGLVCWHSFLLETHVFPHRTHSWIALATVACHVHPQPTPSKKCCGWFPCGSLYFFYNLNGGCYSYLYMSWNFVDPWIEHVLKLIYNLYPSLHRTNHMGSWIYKFLLCNVLYFFALDEHKHLTIFPICLALLNTHVIIWSSFWSTLASSGQIWWNYLHQL
jgi:hypothetical protein